MCFAENTCQCLMKKRNTLLVRCVVKLKGLLIEVALWLQDRKPLTPQLGIPQSLKEQVESQLKGMEEGDKMHHAEILKA